MTSKVLDNVSDKLGVDRKELDNIYDYLTKGIIKESENEEVYSIEFKHLGILVLNSRLLNVFAKKENVSDAYLYRCKYLQYLKDTEAKKYWFHSRIPLEIQYNRKYLKNRNIEPKNSKKIYNQIQTIQNEKK